MLKIKSKCYITQSSTPIPLTIPPLYVLQPISPLPVLQPPSRRAYLERAAGVRASVSTAELLQLLLQLLLPPAPHHRLWVTDGAREARLRQLCRTGRRDGEGGGSESAYVEEVSRLNRALHARF